MYIRWHDQGLGKWIAGAWGNMKCIYVGGGHDLEKWNVSAWEGLSKETGDVE